MAHQTILPALLTSLVGRKRELTEVRRLLRLARLVTLTGAGGVGKTRLALAVAVELGETFAGGVAFVDLASTLHSELVLPAIARALGIRDDGALPLEERLANALHGRELLLVLDNFEQVLPAAPVVLGLLQAAPRVTALVTSRAVLRALRLDRPVLCGWSYGPLVILDYVRHHGEDGIGGVHFTGGITKLGSDEAMAVIAPAFLELVPGLFASDAEESVCSLETLLRLFFAREPSADELYRMLGYNVAVPPYVRQALFSRSFDNDDLLPKIRTPALLTHGALDALLSPAVVEQHKAGMAHAHVHLMANAGHAPFWDDAPAFNQRLRDFCDGL